MKILILHEIVYPDFTGGLEHRNYEVALALRRRGHQVTLAGFSGEGDISTDTKERLSLGRVTDLYGNSGRRSTRHALRFAAAVAHLDLEPYDVIETANFPYVHLLPLAARCASVRRPLLVTWYEFWGAYWPTYVGRARAPIYRAIEWFCAQQGTQVTALSELTRKRLAGARRHGPRDEPIEIVPGGILIERVREAGRGVVENGPPLFFAGRLLEHKRLDLVLRAIEILARDGRAGDGRLLTVFGDGPDRLRLEAFVAQRGLTERVVFRGHAETCEEVWQEMAGARVAVQPSAREGFGLFPLEAMAAGLPVVHCTSSESAVGELVRDGLEGREVEPDPAALADALASLLGPGGEVECGRLGDNGRRRAALYDYDAIGARVEAICQQLVARRKGVR